MDNNVNMFRLDYRIVNNQADELVVKAKGGLTYIIKRPKEPTFTQERIVYVTLEQVDLDTLKIEPELALTKFDHKLLSELAAQLKHLKEKDEFSCRMFNQNVAVKVRLGTSLIESNNAIHSEILGITLYNGLVNMNQQALNTPSLTIQELFNVTVADAEKAPEGGLHHFIFLNDIKRVTAPLYVNILGKAVEVPMVSDEARLPGLYLGVMHGNESPQTLFYTFDSLDDKMLEGMGIFKTRAACEQGGNTERAILAEQKAKQLAIDLGKSRDLVESLEIQLEKSEHTVIQLRAELGLLKSDHKQELAQLKTKTEQEISQLKHQSKVTSEIHKYESRIKETANKANMELVKHKSSVNNWGEFAKAVGTVGGLAFTGWRLFTS